MLELLENEFIKFLNEIPSKDNIDLSNGIDFMRSLQLAMIEYAENSNTTFTSQYTHCLSILAGIGAELILNRGICYIDGKFKIER